MDTRSACGKHHTTSSPLTRRAASTAQSTRLLLRSDLVCVPLWSVRGLGSYLSYLR